MSKKVVIILMTLLTSSLLGGIHPVYSQEADDSQTTAENLLQLLSNTEAEVTTFIDEIVEGEGTVPKKAEEALTLAQTLHTEAQELYDAGSYEESIEKATDALKEYGKALERAQEALDEESEEETEEEAEDETEESEEEVMESQSEGLSEEDNHAKMIGLLSNVEKFLNRIGLLRGIADGLGLEESDEENILLDEAERVLLDIKDNFDSLDESEIVLGEAVRLIGKATGLLKSQSQPIKEQKMEQFKLQTMHRIEQLNKKMAKIMARAGSPLENTLMIQTKYADIIAQLEDVDTSGDLKEAMNQLKILVKETRQIGKGGENPLFSEEAMNSVDDQMEVEERLAAYNETAMALAEDDPLRTEVLELITQVEALIEEAEAAVSEEDMELAEQKLEEAEDILDSIGDLLGEEESNGKGVKPENPSENNGKPKNNKEEPTEETDDPEEETENIETT